MATADDMGRLVLVDPASDMNPNHHLHVALVSEHASPLANLGEVASGGQNVHVAALGRELAAQSANVSIYTRRTDPRLPRRIRLGARLWLHHVDAGPARHLPTDDLLPFMDQFATNLHRIWRRDRPDVVHAHFWMSGYASVEAAARCDVPVVQTFHSLGSVKRRHLGRSDTSPPSRNRIERTITREVAHIIATARAEVAELKALGVDQPRISLIPCGVNRELFAATGPVEPRKRPGMRVLAVSRLVERKGIVDVITALQALPGVELVIAGGPERHLLRGDPEFRRLQQVASDMGVIGQIDFRGRVRRSLLPALYRSADVLACMPWYEPFGLVPLEAMACGTPVAASAVGGILDTVTDGITGMHVKPRDASHLAETLESLLSDRSRPDLGASAARWARRFTWGRVGAQTLTAYRGLVR